ncbi:DNA-formamidopyrimidine glycosylase [Kineobactrum sediminis]|uniref:DNA-formamidopyrimidine glycosylase n=1 Tax=Kineobactrum sediminis TaxID=1905677 RepID=A0A2N5XYY4_9GAMM|nr:DNA-formamidopyrimidine glycosylase family protein [Kineobactrum sediminis]PLW81355.1 DNA-formamidopyrimidine glycosylase [Kineobactrum sediminis]
MPELPDVEVYRRHVSATALHKRIEHVHVEDAAILHDTSAQGLGRALRHKSFRSTIRHGKHLLVEVNEKKWLAMHFGMTGDIKYIHQREQAPDHTRLLISFDNGDRLAYISPRKLGQITFTESPEQWLQQQQLGPDAIALSEADFMDRAKDRRGSVKSWLMDQKMIAGIGNVYADEILFHAGIHPRQPVNRLDRETCKRLYQAIRPVLEGAIEAHADPEQMPSGWLLPHRSKGEHCPACGEALATTKVSGRTAWYCPQCQDS